MQISKVMRREQEKMDKGMNKKGNLQLMTPAILALVFAAIVLVFGLVITQELVDTQGTTTEAYRAGNLTVVGLGTFADFWEIIVLAVVVAVVIGLLLIVFSSRRVK